MQIRVYTNQELSIEDYHASEGISKSGLDKINRSPLHYWQAYLNADRKAREETPALIEGRAFHSLLGEPHLFDEQFCVAPVCDRRTKDGKSQWEAFNLANIGKTLLTEDQHARVQGMVASVRAHPAYQVLFVGGGRAEHSFYWRDPHFDVVCKTRPDWINKDGVIVDYKTTQDASPHGFAKSCANYRYEVSTAFGLDGVRTHEPEVGPYILLAIEKEEPFACAFYQLDQESVDVGRVAYIRNLATYASCKQADKWPGYPPTIESLSLPGWKLKEFK